MTEALPLLIAAGGTGGFVAVLWQPFVERLRGNGGGEAATLRAEMVATGMDPAPLPVYLLGGRGAAAALLCVFWGLLAMPPLAVVLAGIAYVSTPWAVRNLIRRYRRAVNEQVAGATRNLAGQVRVGLPLGEAVGVVARDTPAPLGHHLRDLSRQIAQGRDVQSALASLRAAVRVDAVTTLAVSLQVAEERGGKLADVLDRVAEAAEALTRIEKKRETDTAAGRLMVTLMALFPLLFLGVVYAMDPEMLAKMSEQFVGQLVLAAVALIVYAAVRWASWILNKVEFA